MLDFNTEFQTGDAKITQIRLNVEFASGDTVDLTEEHVMLGGFTRDTSTTVDGVFTVGGAVTGKATIVIDNSDNTLSGYDFRDSVVTVSIGGYLTDGTNEILQIGIYTVDEYSYDGSNITLTAYDNLYKFDVPCASSNVIFPMTITQLITQACSVAGVSLANSYIPNGSFKISNLPRQWDTMTWHDVISYCAQMICCYAKILPNGSLYFSWYDDSAFNQDSIDGGSYDTTTIPYSDGDDADGGDFTYSESTSYDGGNFGDRDYHVLGSIFDMAVDTDDVQITGVTVTLDPTNNINATEDTVEYSKTFGTLGYIVIIENNPLIETKTAADSICSYLYKYLVGMRFRPLTATILENPSVEAGDIGLLIDRYNNTHRCFLSRVTYTMMAATTISCDAERSMQNLRYRYTESQKTRALAHRVFSQVEDSVNSSSDTIVSALATTLGLYQFTEYDDYGGVIYTYGNSASLASSKIRWRIHSGEFAVSTDYGNTWNAAISSDGIAAFKEVYAIKVIADNIVSGNLTVGGKTGNTDGAIYIKDSSGNILGTLNKNGITFKGNISSGSNIKGSSIEGGTIKGSTINLGGTNNTNGVINVYDSDKNLCGLIDKDGLSILGSTISISTTKKSAVKLAGGGCSVYHDENANYTYSKVRNLELADSAGLFDSATAYKKSSTGVKEAMKGVIVSTPQDFIAFGEYHYSLGDKYIPYMWIVIDASSSWTVSGVGNRNIIIPKNISFYAAGSKYRAVETKRYETVSMNAFETANPYFADIGTGTIGEDGSVTIFFDPVFEDTIDTNMDYQVFLTRTSEAKTEWVDKQDGYFIVHGDPGATFDWMVAAHQVEYSLDRMERAEIPPDEIIPDGPLVEEDVSALETVENMVDKFNSQLEVIL